MSQVGRISGPLLTANLERNGIDLAFRNTSGSTQLLYLDVNNGKIGVNKGSAGYELDVNSTIHATNLISTNTSYIANLTVSQNNITTLNGDINLSASQLINLSGLSTDNININDNIISSFDSNSNIDLRPNGTGKIDIFSDLEIYGNLHSNQNITFDGTITFGDDINQDTVIFNTDINSDIIPNDSGTYNLGSINTKWNAIYTNLVNGTSVSATSIIVDNLDYNLKLGNTFYVSVNGNDNNSGDSVFSPFQTVKKALDASDGSTSGPVTIRISAGEYQEELPLTVPSNVTVMGDDTRNTIITPDTSTQSNDVFLLNGESTVQNLTIKNFYYNSGTNTGYAFRFAPNTVVSTRSPYIQNVTVITQGTTTSVSDPRGFASGDAGKGALVDGASVNSASNEASMLFHSVTFITPGVDALTTTNGVRVEWLNSFTYFANRGMYAVRGSTGHLSSDGSTTQFGAEIRSIGSANVYGNYGAVADGVDCLMYLIQHNLAYIGTGKFLDNDTSRVIQSQEITELNNGKVYYQTTDHNGNFRVGEQFFVNQETGETSLVITEAQVDALNGLTVKDVNGKITLIDGEKIETGSLRLANNTILSTLGDINIISASGLINLNSTNIHKDLDISGDLSFSGDLNLLGNQSTDIVDFNVNFDQNINPNQDSTFNLGSAAKEWLFTNTNRANLADIKFTENYLTTTVSNADLELQASGTNEILIPNNNTRAGNNLTVSNNTDLQDINITGILTHVGNRNQTGNYSTTNLTVQNLTVGSQVQFEEINIDGNVITTTTSNTDLELRANSTGIVLIPNQDVIINNDFNIQGSSLTSDINVAQQVEASTFDNNTININANVITTDISNADLELRASGKIIIPSNDVQISNNLTVSNNTDLQDINITGIVTHVGNRPQTGNYSTIDLTITSDLDVNSQTQFEEINIDGNVITTTTSNTDLELRANNAGNILITNSNTGISNDLTVGTLNAPTINIDNTFAIENLNSSSDIEIFDNIIRTTNSNSNLELRASGTGYVGLQDIHIKDNVLQTVSDDITFNVTNNLTILGTLALKIPTGTIPERSLNLGDIRFNTFDNVFEATSNDVISFGGVYSNDRRTSLTAHPTNNTIAFQINNAQVGVVNSNGIELSSLQVDDILINSNTILTNVSNADLEVSSTRNTLIDDFKFNGNIITNTNGTNENFKFNGTGTHLVVFDSNYAVRFPSGTTAERPSAPQIGLTRHNSDTDVLETYDGTKWIPSAGLSESISSNVMEDLSIQQSLIYG
jgi:hypothetical protein